MIFSPFYVVSDNALQISLYFPLKFKIVLVIKLYDIDSAFRGKVKKQEILFDLCQK